MKTIIKIILLAVVSAVLAIVAEQILAVFASILWQKEIILEFYSQLTWFLVAAAVIEESLKYWAICSAVGKKFELQKAKLIFSAVSLGLAWGIFEAGLAVYSGNAGYLPLFLLVLLHTLTAFLIGTLISTGAASGRLKHLKILFLPVIVHLLFNLLIIKLA